MKLIKKELGFVFLSILFLGTVSVFAGNVFVGESGISAEYSSSSGSVGESYNVTYRGEDNGLYVMMFEDGIFVGVANESSGGGSNPSWWDASWGKRKDVTITETSGVDLVNYSVWLNVSYESEMQGDFDDLRFVLDGEVLSYYVEEKVDSDWAGVYVKVPLLEASSEVVVEMYYGNGGVSSLSSEVGIDKAGLAAYYKMDENAASTFVLDSTGNHNGTTSVNTNTLSSDGKIKGGLDLYSSKDVKLGIWDYGTDTMTASVWAKFETLGTSTPLIFQQDGGTYNGIWIIKDTSDRIYARFGKGSSPWISATTTMTVTTGVWYKIAVVKTSTTWKIYIDSVERASLTTSEDISHSGSIPLSFGRLGYDGALMDEVGLWTRALSPSEISEQYNSYNGKIVYAESEPTISFSAAQSE